MKAKICPKCHSLNIRARWQSFWFAGFPSTYECRDCGFKSYIFPRIELTKANVNKLIRLKTKHERKRKRAVEKIR